MISAEIEYTTRVEKDFSKIQWLKMLSNYYLITFNNRELDLSGYKMITEFLEACNLKYILLAVGLVGGILLNQKYP